MKNLLLILILIIVSSADIFGQAIPKQIDYQGVLKDVGGNLITGDVGLTFKIYNEPSGGTPLWTELQVIPVQQGIFSAHLGATTPITTVPFDRVHYLGITVGTGAELTPRTMLSPTPYSFMTLNVMDNSINSAKIEDESITTADIAEDAVTEAKILNEPGIAEVGSDQSYPITSTSNMTTVLTLTISIPAEGYIVLEGKSFAWLNGATGQNQVYMQIDDEAGGNLESPNWTKAGLGDYASTDNSFFPMYCQRIFNKTAGTYTFYLEAMAVPGNVAGTTTNIYQPQLQAIYYPTAYGNVGDKSENTSNEDKSLK